MKVVEVLIHNELKSQFVMTTYLRFICIPIRHDYS